ncbi:AAA-domain-containing protein [Panaeolus papilionaceus]|nr:AAA-domain-containing protein [Panaeolus papilionaceus]
MLEPMQQCYAEKGITKLILVAPDANISLPLDVSPHLDDASDADPIEIDEEFLANSVLSNQLEGFASQAPESHNQHSNAEGLKAAGLGGMQHSLVCLPTVHDAVEDDINIYLRTADLAKVGVRSGDWVIIGSQLSSSCRLAKVAGNDELTSHVNVACGSPTMVYNIVNESQFFSLHPLQVTIAASPFGSQNPTIPIARSITVARVASPISTNKSYLSTFTESLKEHFLRGNKLVKLGDIFAVAIDTDASHWVEAQTQEHQQLLPRSREMPISPNRKNATVFFKVTNVEYESVNSSNGASRDIYSGSTLGELGCWVDASQTRVVQVGVEHARVPDVQSYFGLDSFGSNLFRSLSSLPSSALLGKSSPFQKLCTLASAGLLQGAIDYDLPLSFLLRGNRGTGKFTTTSWVAHKLGLHLFEIDCYDLLGDTDTKTEGTLRARFEQAKTCTPCLLVLKHLEAFATNTQDPQTDKDSGVVMALRDCIEDIGSAWKMTGYPLILVGTMSEGSSSSSALLSLFKQEILFEAPNEAERLEMILGLLAGQDLAPDVSTQSVATQTAALVAGDLKDLINRAKSAALQRVLINGGDGALKSMQKAQLTAADFELALLKARDSYSESIGAPKIPTVSWDDVGGLAHVKNDILDTIQLPLDHPELFSDGLKKRSGILLYGPPGTGKTLVAKAVATSCSLNFFSVKGPELLNMYIGESEANVRRVFQRARDAKPCVIFFDELDSVAPKRGNHGDSGGVMDRIVSQLLAELDGMSGGHNGSDVFVIGATNRPDLLDSALLRPGRFDRMLYLGVSETHDAQWNILQALTRKFRLDPDLDLRTVAERCTFNFTGADFYALCSDAMLNAMTRKAESVDTRVAVLNTERKASGLQPITPQYFLSEIARLEDILVYVSQEDFDRALRNLTPSVSEAEMEHYAKVQKRFSQKTERELVE